MSSNAAQPITCLSEHKDSLKELPTYLKTTSSHILWKLTSVNQSINTTPIMREIISEKHEKKTNQISESFYNFLISENRIEINDSAGKKRKTKTRIIVVVRKLKLGPTSLAINHAHNVTQFATFSHFTSCFQHVMFLRYSEVTWRMLRLEDDLLDVST